MAPDLSILYRGPLASCNYGCDYCPFAKRVDSRERLERDAAALTRFVDWVSARRSPTSVLFTPWGEALIRRPYRHALIALSHMEHVPRVAIQTNLSVRLEWLERARCERLGVWATFHPAWTERQAFVAKIGALHERGVHVSAGVVGLREHFDDIATLRRELPSDVYLWINAFKRTPGYYDDREVARLSAIDPLFSINNRYHPSIGRACHAGDDVISVDGEGDARRCHFIPDIIGNIYEPDFETRLHARPCTNQTCGCHIGYVHLEHLGLRALFGPGVLERVPRYGLPGLPGTPSRVPRG